MNTVDLSKNDAGHVVVSIRSEGQTDQSAVISDPYQHIMGVAALAGLQVTVTGGEGSPEPV